MGIFMVSLSKVRDINIAVILSEVGRDFAANAVEGPAVRELTDATNFGETTIVWQGDEAGYLELRTRQR